MKVLVTASNGTIGSRVVRLLKKHPSIEVRQTSRNPQSQDQVAFDFNNEGLIRSALGGVQKVIMITPASPDELEVGVRFVQICRQAGVAHLIFMSIHQVERAPLIPHFASKIAIQKELEKSGMKWTTIAPNNFFENDFWFKSALMESGIYPQPFGSRGLSRVSADDVAQALVNAVSREDLAGQIYPLVGPETLTFQQVCQVFEKYLGKKICYGGDDLDQWEQQNKALIPSWLLEDWKQMYAFFQKEGLRASVGDYIQQEKILGRAPRSFDAFVRETVQFWKQ